MSQNPLVEQAKQGNINAIASLMNRLLKSQGMLANVERDGDRLEILIESDLRSLDDEMRIPKRQVLVGMLRKWFITLEVKTVSSIIVSWQQTGSDEPAWTEEINLGDRRDTIVSENGGITEPPSQLKILPLPVLPRKPMLERNDLSDRANSQKPPTASNPDLDEMFGAIESPEPLPNINLTNNLNSDLESTSSSQSQDLLLSPNFPAIADTASDLETETTSSASNTSRQTFSWQSLLKTPIFAFQLAQYVVICVIIIFALRGIHTAFGGSKAPKASSIAVANLVRT
ncbi:MAG: hypothetical protein LH649_13780 [Pseudanabaena sp. CAN_BIN31]|nr:hypothetical protein [Pseudanabaena sp. CAN_BIN31]